jgi:hypothetical protein
MTTRLKELLERQAASPLFDAKGDDERDGAWYYTATLECLLPLIARAAVEDGVSAETVMKFLVSTAFETLRDPRAIPGEGREIGALVVQEAQRLYSGLYPTAEEVEELKREAATWRAAHPQTTKRQGQAENSVQSTKTH